MVVGHASTRASGVVRRMAGQRVRAPLRRPRVHGAESGNHYPL
jgi:hypothetical protein